MTRAELAQLGLLVGAFVAVVVLIANDRPACRSVVLQRDVAPDSSVEAVTFRHSCGVLGESTRNVSLTTPGEEYAASGNALIVREAELFDTSRTTFGVQWLSQSHVEICLPDNGVVYRQTASIRIADILRTIGVHSPCSEADW